MAALIAAQAVRRIGTSRNGPRSARGSARQAQRALGQDVAQHLVGAAFDAVDRTEAEHLVELAHFVVARQRHGRARRAGRDRRRRSSCVVRAPTSLPTATSGAGLFAAFERGEDAVHAVAQAGDLGVPLGEPHRARPGCRSARVPSPAGAERQPEQLVEAHRRAGAERHALVATASSAPPASRRRRSPRR